MEQVSRLQKAILEFKPINKNGRNPFFKNSNNPQGSPYALLEDIQKAIMPALNQQGFYINSTVTDNQLVTRLIDISTKEVVTFVSSPLYVEATKNAMQSLGGCITYATRYNLQMMFCLDCDSDEDGNKVEEVMRTPAKAQPDKIAEIQKKAVASEPAFTVPKEVQQRLEKQNQSPPPMPPPQSKGQPPSEAQIRALYGIANDRGLSIADIALILTEKYKKSSLTEIDRTQYQVVRKEIEAMEKIPF